MVNWTTSKFFSCRWAAKELCRTAKLAPLATRHRRRSPQLISTYRSLLSTYGPANSSSLFPCVERVVVWACLQLLGDVSMPSERRRSASVPGFGHQGTKLHHAPSTEANHLLRIRHRLEQESTSCAMSSGPGGGGCSAAGLDVASPGFAIMLR